MAEFFAFDAMGRTLIDEVLVLKDCGRMGCGSGMDLN